MALNRLENSWQFTDDQIVPVYLDLIAYRSISNELADRLHVMHQSPQVLLVKDGHCTYHASHNQIDTRSIKSNL
jgi:bacillithiol system protein YtxJ